MVPDSASEEKKNNNKDGSGFTKYNMGAALVKDGFQEYERLCMCRDTVVVFQVKVVDDVADKRVIKEIDNYGRAIDKFTDIMEDLGLLQIITKAQKK